MSMATEVCKIGQGERCCRYLVVGMNGFECMKLQPSTRAYIDRQVELERFNAVGDNCGGIEGVLPDQQPPVIYDAGSAKGGNGA